MAKNGAHKGGRPKGSVSKRTKAIRAIADKALESGKHPLEIMLANMHFFEREADALLARILAGVGKQKPAALIAALSDLCSFKKRAQECAVDAAPYVHAKLSAVHIEGEISHKNVEADAAYKTIAGTLEQVITAPAVGSGEQGKLVEKSALQPAHS